MNYAELLNNPKWKNKRKKILKRDDYKCTACGGKKNLKVHHTFYFSDYPLPWEYPNKSLLTVCEKCHREYHLTHENQIKNRDEKKKKKITKKHKVKQIKKKKIVKQISLAELQMINGLKIRKRNTNKGFIINN